MQEIFKKGPLQQTLAPSNRFEGFKNIGRNPFMEMMKRMQ